MIIFWAFVIGGLICVIGQLLIDLTKLTPARILVFFVVAGCILGGFGWYDRLAGGLTVAVIFGYLGALVSKPRARE